MVDVSVIIPTFRRARELGEALDSVRRQHNVEWEAIVVDDSPEEEAREVTDTFSDPRITYLVNPTPTGGRPGRARNLGWPRARGRLLHFLDDDDLVPSGLYAWAKHVFDNLEIGIVFGRVEPFGSVSKEQIEQEKKFFSDAARRAAVCLRFGSKWGFTAQMLFDRALLVCGAAVVRSDCLMSVGGFDPGLRLREDLDLFLSIARKCGAHYDDRISLHYRIGTPSLMHAPVLLEADIRDLDYARGRTQAKYLAEYGALEYYTLKIFNKIVLKRL